MKVYCPDGHEILGTLEVLQGRASVVFRRDDQGEVEWEHDGRGTELFYDGMQTLTKDGSACFLCEDGDEWTLEECIVEDDEEEQ